ncbi:cytochrome b5 isoform X2 [Calliopsis andreniformis]|uniref:cytochrome b5 isoform X2 n=1 Tax=Calliopsis andreniformis TaxID=337506 RepID=UPI003FCEC38A
MCADCTSIVKGATKLVLKTKDIRWTLLYYHSFYCKIKNMATENSTVDTATTKLYTRAEVFKHTENNDLWIIIHNKVYNLSSFLNEHPGGEEVLLELGGRDGTEPFEDIGHSSDARQMMESYKIGEIVEEERTKGNASDANAIPAEDNTGGSWRSWLIPIALGVLATLVYRYFIKAH